MACVVIGKPTGFYCRANWLVTQVRQLDAEETTDPPLRRGRDETDAAFSEYEADGSLPQLSRTFRGLSTGTLLNYLSYMY
jgi:hypothetical protein